MEDLFSESDAALEAVAATLRNIRSFDRLVSLALRQALEEVVDGGRTGRWSVEQLEKTEKTYIGTKVEIVLRHELELSSGNVLDTLIAGEEVDIKFSIQPFGHEIPREAVGRLCLLAWADDETARYRLGLVRALPQYLGAPNNDGKRKILASARERIRILSEGKLPVNFILNLPQGIREAIMSPRDGQARVNELFRRVQGVIIPRHAILTAAHQKDGMKRARDARIPLARERIRILCGDWHADRRMAEASRLPALKKGEWLSFALQWSDSSSTV